MKKCFLRFGKISVLVLLMLLVMPSLVHAEVATEKNIFAIIQNKMITTVLDVRKIVYIIAGFGLIMFSVLAIFNKISFKHLGYIMISLSLLALITPFIEYFTGERLSIKDTELSYEDYLQQEAAIQGTDPEAFPEEVADVPMEGEFGTGVESEAADEAVEGNLGGVDGPTSTGLLGGNDTPITPDEEKKSFGERVRNFIDDANDFVNAVGDGIDAVQHGKQAVAGVVAGAQNVVDAARGEGDFFDKVGNVSTAIGNATYNVSSNLQGVTGNAGNVADYLTPGNGSSGVSDYLDGVSEDITDDRSKINDWTNTGEKIRDVSDKAEYQVDRIFGRR